MSSTPSILCVVSQPQVAALLMTSLPLIFYGNLYIHEEGMATHSSIPAWRIPMDRGGWQAAVHRVTKSQTRLKQLSMQACIHVKGLPWWLSGKEFACQCRWCRFSLGVGKIPWKRKWQPAPVFLSGEFHGQKSLAGYSPGGHKSIGHDLMTKQRPLLTGVRGSYVWTEYWALVCPR